MFDGMLKKTARILKRAPTVCFNVLVTGGSFLTSIGSKVFVLNALIEFFNMDGESSWAVAAKIAGIVSAAYVFLFSSGLRTLRLTTRGDQDYAQGGKKTIEYSLSKGSKICAQLILYSASLAAFVNFGWLFYCNSDALFQFFEMPEGIALTSIDAYLAITSSLTLIMFAFPPGKKNLYAFFDSASKRFSVCPRPLPAIVAGSIGSVKTVTQFISNVYILEFAFDNFLPKMDPELQAIFAFILTALSVPICAQNRTNVLYDYLKEYKLSRICSHQVQEGSSYRKLQHVLYRTHDVLGFFHVLFDVGLSYVSFAVFAEKYMKVSADNLAIIVLNIIMSIGGSAIDYAFTNRAMYDETKILFQPKERRLDISSADSIDQENAGLLIPEPDENTDSSDASQSHVWRIC